MRSVYRLVWIGALLAILGMSAWFLAAPPRLPVIAAFTTYTSDDKSLVLQYPANWQPHEFASHAVTSALSFKPNATTHFSVGSSLAGSLMGDVARSNNASLAALPGMPADAADKLKTPLEMLHAARIAGLAKSKTGYGDFLPQQAAARKVGGVDALSTDFTYSTGGVWGRRQMDGCLVTILTGDREVTVTATTAADLKKSIRPIFDRMIDSIRLGQTGG